MKTIILNSGFSCSEDFYLRVKNQILEVVPIIRRDHPDIKWTVEMLCGELFWDELSDGQCRAAGNCMVDLVESGQVPFVNVPRTGRNPYPLQYKLKEKG